MKKLNLFMLLSVFALNSHALTVDKSTVALGDMDLGHPFSEKRLVSLTFKNDDDLPIKNIQASINEALEADAFKAYTIVRNSCMGGVILQKDESCSVLLKAQGVIEGEIDVPSYLTPEGNLTGNLQISYDRIDSFNYSDQVTGTLASKSIIVDKVREESQEFIQGTLVGGEYLGHNWSMNLGSVGSNGLYFGYQPAVEYEQTVTGLIVGESYSIAANMTIDHPSDGNPVMLLDGQTVRTMYAGNNTHNFVATANSARLSFYIGGHQIGNAAHFINNIHIIGPRKNSVTESYNIGEKFEISNASEKVYAQVETIDRSDLNSDIITIDIYDSSLQGKAVELKKYTENVTIDVTFSAIPISANFSNLVNNQVAYPIEIKRDENEDQKYLVALKDAAQGNVEIICPAKTGDTTAEAYCSSLDPIFASKTCHNDINNEAERICGLVLQVSPSDSAKLYELKLTHDFDYRLPKNCHEVLMRDPSLSGTRSVYKIDPLGDGNVLEVICNMQLDPQYGLTQVAQKGAGLNALGDAAIGSISDAHFKLKTSDIDNIQTSADFWYIKGTHSGVTNVLTASKSYNLPQVIGNSYTLLGNIYMSHAGTAQGGTQVTTGGCGTEYWLSDPNLFYLLGQSSSPGHCWAYPTKSDFYDYHIGQSGGQPSAGSEIYLRGKAFKHPRSCDEAIQRNPSVKDGLYTIDPDGWNHGVAPTEVSCDMNLGSGGFEVCSDNTDCYAKFSAGKTKLSYNGVELSEKNGFLHSTANSQYLGTKCDAWYEEGELAWVDRKLDSNKSNYLNKDYTAPLNTSVYYQVNENMPTCGSIYFYANKAANGSGYSTFNHEGTNYGYVQSDPAGARDGVVQFQKGDHISGFSHHGSRLIVRTGY